MNPTAFLLAVRCRTQATSSHPDPLAAAWRFLEERGDTRESRALRRIIKTLGNGCGEYSESDMDLLGDDAVALVAALLDARERCLYSEEEWQATG